MDQQLPPIHVLVVGDGPAAHVTGEAVLDEGVQLGLGAIEADAEAVAEIRHGCRTGERGR